MAAAKGVERVGAVLCGVLVGMSTTQRSESQLLAAACLLLAPGG